MSSTQAIRFGVPQRSILGPLLFVLYIYDLPQCLENCSINMYADDTVMYFTNLCTSEIARVVQDDLNEVVQSMESSRLKNKINALWKLTESCQITKSLYTVIQKDFRKSSLT